MSQADQTQQIRQNIDDDLLTAAQEEDVDVDEIIESQVAKRGDSYGVDTIARFAKTAIERKVEAAKSETLSGILMGSRDRYGANWPRRHSLVSADGDHVEVSTWVGSLPGPDGSEMPIPKGGALVDLSADFDQDYESWQARQIQSAKEIPPADLVGALENVAQEPSSITPNDEYEVRVITGTIMWVNPQTVFPEDDDEDFYDGEVQMTDGRQELQPHFEVVLDAEEGTRFRAHAQRQKNGRMYFQVPDLEQLLRDAYEEFDDPESQAQFLEDGLRDREVIIVGTVSGYDTDRDDEGNPIEYIDMNMSGMVASGDQSLSAFEEADDSAEFETDGEDTGDEDADAESVDDESDDHVCEGCGKSFDSPQALNGHKSSCDEVGGDADDGDDDGSGSEPEPDEGAVAEIEESIAEYERLTDESLESVEEVRENLKGVGDGYDDIEIRAALSGDVGSAQESDDEFADLLEGGTYNCPGEDCIASASSVGELAGHAAGEHDTADYDDAKGWIRAQM